MDSTTTPAEIFVGVTDGSLFGTKVATIEDQGAAITLSPIGTRELTDQVDGSKHRMTLGEYGKPPLRIEGEEACAAVRQFLQWAWGQSQERYEL